MTKDTTGESRRNVLKLLAGSAAGTAGFSTAATAEDVQWDESDIVQNDNGDSQWILRIDRNLTDTREVTKQTAKSTAESSQEAVAQAVSARDEYTIENQFWLTNAMLVTASKDDEAAVQELSALSGVRTVHPNFEIPAPDPIQDDYVRSESHDSAQYGLNQINALDVWDQYNTQGEGSSVAVLDTGIDPDHPDLEFNEANWAYFDGNGELTDTEPFDDDGHGTHVSGTVAGGMASGFPGAPHLGVAPETELYNVKVLDPSGTYAQIVGGMQWAVEQDVDVINMSLGAPGYTGAYIEPAQNAREMGTLVVSSSGNSGQGVSGSPGNIYENLAVGATDRNGDVTGFSSGEKVRTDVAFRNFFHLTDDWPLNYYVPDVSAPGNQVVSSVPGGGYSAFSGTSMASPHTAGAAALIRSLVPDASPTQIEAALTATARHGDGPDANPGPRYGEGIIDVLSAVTALTDSNFVEGTVTYEGNPASGVEVSSDFGTTAETAIDGSFLLYLGDGDWELSATAFGQAGTTSVSVSDSESIDGLDIQLQDVVDVIPLSGQPDVIGTGEEFTITVEVDNLESYGVELTNSAVAAEDVTLDVAGATLQPGESVDLSNPVSDTVTVTVSVSSDADTGLLSLVHEFGGAEGPIEVTTGPTEVMEDPADGSLQVVTWDQTTSVILDEVIVPFLVVQNTGDRTVQATATWWVSNPATDAEFDVTIPRNVSVPGGEQAQVQIPLILVPDPVREPGAEFTHGWQIGDETVQTTATFDDAVYTIDQIDAPNQVDAGDQLDIDVTIANEGTVGVGGSVTFFFDGVGLERKSMQADPEQATTVTFQFDTSQVVRDTYEYGFLAGNDQATETVRVGEPTVPPRFSEYVNAEGVVDSSGLNAAIQDSLSGDLSASDLNAVIESYLTGDPLSNFL